MWIASVCFALLVSFFVLSCDADFVWPKVTIEPLRPRGFRVSIPDQPGISLFAFHGKVNEEMEGREAGTYSVDITKAKKNRWTYNNKNAVLKPGDVLYYWTYADYDDGTGKRGYPLDDQEFAVSELFEATNTSGGQYTPQQTPTPTPPSQPTPASCKMSETIVSGNQVCKGQLVFEEHFNGNLGSRWTVAAQFSTYPDYSYVMYERDSRNLYVSNGLLYIKPSLSEERHGPDFIKSHYDFGQECTGVKNTEECNKTSVSFHILPPVISGQITTKNSFSFLYGVVEIRARFPEGDWIYPELFLQPLFDHYGQLTDSGFVRIAVSAGNTNLRNELRGGCVVGSSELARKRLLPRISRRESWNNNFNTYKLEWRPNLIQVSVNGEIYGNISPPQGGFGSLANELELDINTVERWRRGGPLAPFDKELFLGIGVGVGGLVLNDFENTVDFDFSEQKALLKFDRIKDSWYSTWNNRSVLEVDYVKVWAL